MFIINRNIQKKRQHYVALCAQSLKNTSMVNKNHQQQLVIQRQLSIWTIPKVILATTNKSNRKWIVGALGAATFLSSVLGPVVWVTVGGAASIATWRLFQKTKSWWNYLSPMIASNNNNVSGIPSVTEAILSQIGTHHAAELVRVEAIKQLKYFFEKTDQGKQMLDAFGLDHPRDLVWEDVHKSEAVRLKDKTKHKVSVNFWLEDQTSSGPKGGGCEVTATAIVSGQGKIDLDQVKLSAPNHWHKDEVIPLSSSAL